MEIKDKYKYERIIKDGKLKYKPDSSWGGRKLFLHKLEVVEKYLRNVNKYFKNDSFKDCILCKFKAIDKGYFQLGIVRWSDALFHYISEHKIKPSQEFLDVIYRFDTKKSSVKRNIVVSLNGDRFVRSGMMFIKIKVNQMMILDALMVHGGFGKRYVDDKNDAIFRYSEHTGLLDFKNDGLEKILISGKTNIVDSADNDIFFPKNMDDALDYEYIFHTHPATPRPGSRAIEGILYEFPSVGDIYHFLDHYNDGLTQGSIVITPEGMYIIRKNELDAKKIHIDEDKLHRSMRTVIYKNQDDAIKKYGTNFSQEKFMSVIARDTTYIDNINNVLNKYKMHIDYYPRVKDKKNRWIIDSVYLPVFAIEAAK